MAKPAIQGFGSAFGWNRVQVTGFTNGEEDEMKLSHVVPFLVEDELLRLGAIFEKKADWQTFTITDGRLITGQNPASWTGPARSAFEAGRAKGSRLGIKSDEGSASSTLRSTERDRKR